MLPGAYQFTPRSFNEKYENKLYKDRNNTTSLFVAETVYKQLHQVQNISPLILDN